MNSDTPLLTDSSRLASEQNVQNYSVGVAAHINGDWLTHVQVVVIDKNWVDSAGNTIPNSKRLRILGTLSDGTNIAVVLPIVPFSSTAAGNGPQITVQPVNQTVLKGGSVTFVIQAVGDPALAYVWRHNRVVITGAVSAQLALTNVQQIDGGTYDCVVSNPFGVVTTNEVNLAVTVKKKKKK